MTAAPSDLILVEAEGKWQFLVDIRIVNFIQNFFFRNLSNHLSIPYIGYCAHKIFNDLTEYFVYLFNSYWERFVQISSHDCVFLYFYFFSQFCPLLFLTSEDVLLDT